MRFSIYFVAVTNKENICRTCVIYLSIEEVYLYKNEFGENLFRRQTREPWHTTCNFDKVGSSLGILDSRNSLFYLHFNYLVYKIRFLL